MLVIFTSSKAFVLQMFLLGVAERFIQHVQTTAGCEAANWLHSYHILENQCDLTPISE